MMTPPENDISVGQERRHHDVSNGREGGGGSAIVAFPQVRGILPPSLNDHAIRGTGVTTTQVPEIPRSAVVTPAWNGPTRELPVIHRARVIPEIGQPALVATTRRIPLSSKASRTWRPDLWPAWVWTPLVLLPGLAAGIVAIILAHLVANLIP